MRNIIGETFLQMKVWIQFENQTAETFSNDDDSAEFSIKTTFGEMEYVEEVSVFIQFDEKAGYQEYKCYSQGGNIYSKKIERESFVNQEYLNYYFVVDNGFYEVVLDQGVMSNIDAIEEGSYNLQDGAVVSEVQELVTTEESLWFDGVDVTEETYVTVAGDPVIIFDTAYTDSFFKNVVAIDDDIVGIFNEGTYDSWQTYIYEIETTHFNQSDSELTIAFHSGNKANLLQHDVENNDDFLLKNIHMVLPDGEILYPQSYEAKIGAGAVTNQAIEIEESVEVLVGAEEEIAMGDQAGDYEILYVTFELPEDAFDAICYSLDTKLWEDGVYEIENGLETLEVKIDNTPPEIVMNLEDGAIYNEEQISVMAVDEIDGERTSVEVWLDGDKISNPESFDLLNVGAGSHTITAVASDGSGNVQERAISIEVPYTIEATYDDTYQKYETVGFEQAIVVDQDEVGYPVQQFEVEVESQVSSDDFIEIIWSGISNNQKTFMYLYNYDTMQWEDIEAKQVEVEGVMTLSARIIGGNYDSDGKIQVKVQNGEGYYMDYKEVLVEDSIYDFTFVTQSDTQYYNEDFEGNSAKKSDGNYTCQLAINDWIVANQEEMNIAYMFHDGDIVDDYDVEEEWQLSDVAYAILDDANLPYGVLAGNHDVGHLLEDYSFYSEYFGESRYMENDWYGESFEDNKGHYDLITVGDVDFIMLYMGWGVGEEEIKWMNYILEKYSERNAILNFHEYLLASGGMGEEALLIREEVVATNSNVIMVQSGHYHNALTKVDWFVNTDGSIRYVYNMLFDYQGLEEGGMGYIRLLHFDVEEARVFVETYSPYLDDYNAKSVLDVNERNDYVVDGADEEITGRETFELDLNLVGIQIKEKTLETIDLTVDVYKIAEET